MRLTELRKVKHGEFFRLANSESAPVWVRGEYDRSEGNEFSVNLQFFPDALSDMLSHHYTGYEFVDGYPKGGMEVRLTVFKLIKPLPHLEEF